jgi:NADPH:quinone reductase-like Zn-dependent oxidoreductase
MTSLPAHQTAVLVAAPGEITLTANHPIPDPETHELQVRVHAVALNPSDWMARDRNPAPGAVLGSDYAGTVVAVGSSVDKKWKPGDRIAGFVQGGTLYRTARTHQLANR